MNSLETELNKIEIALEQLSSGEISAKFMNELINLRRELESYQSDVIKQNMMLRIAELQTCIDLYKLTGEYKEPKKILDFATQTRSKLPANLSQKKEFVQLLILELDSLKEIEDARERKQKILDIESEFKETEFVSRECEQALAKAKYEMMTAFLKEGMYEEAKDFSKNFKEDMRLYITKRLKDKLPELKASGKINNAKLSHKYVYNSIPKEDDMRLWENIMQVEHPELDFKMPSLEETPKTQKQENLPIPVEKKGFIESLKSRIETSNEYKKQGIQKTFTIRYDSKDPDGINRKDLQHMLKYLYCNNKQAESIAVVFEEGITRIDYESLKKKIPKRLGDKNAIDNIKQISLPSTLEDIAHWPWDGACKGVQSLDLSKTQLAYINNGLFNGFKNLQQIALPPTLEKINEYAFWACSSLKEIDLSETNVRVIDSRAFANCKNLKQVKFSKKTEEIGYLAFSGCVRLEEVDFSETHLKVIKARAFSSYTDKYYEPLDTDACTSLRKVKFPKKPIKIERTAFWGCPLPEEIDLPEGSEIHSDAFFSEPVVIKPHQPKKNQNVSLAKPDKGEVEI